MKPILFLLAIFGICPAYALRTVLTGTVTTVSTTGILSLTYYKSILDYIERRKTCAAATLTDGVYKFILNLERPIIFSMKDGEHWLTYQSYLAPGDSLALSFSDSTNGFGGTCGDCNAMLFLKAQTVAQLIAERDSAEKGDFSQWIRNARKWRDGALHMPDTFASNQKLPPEFLKQYQTEVDYGFATELLLLSWSHPQLMSDGRYLDCLRNIRFDDPTLLQHERYVNFLRELPYSSWKAMCRQEKNPVRRARLSNRGERIRDSIARSFFTGEVLDIARYQIYNDRLRTLEWKKNSSEFLPEMEDAKRIIRKAISSFDAEGYPQRLLARLREMTGVKAAPDFALKDLNGNTVRLSDFRGKVVYVDFWATNCAPCIAEIPKAVALQERFAGRDIVFLFVSMGDRVADLKPFLEKHGFSGLHLSEPLGFASNLAASYGVSGMPHCLLVDRHGMLASGDAPRPGMNPEPQIEYQLQKQ